MTLAKRGMKDKLSGKFLLVCIVMLSQIQGSLGADERAIAPPKKFISRHYRDTGVDADPNEDEPRDANCEAAQDQLAVTGNVFNIYKQDANVEADQDGAGPAGVPERLVAALQDIDDGVPHVQVSFNGTFAIQIGSGDADNQTTHEKLELESKLLDSLMAYLDEERKCDAASDCSDVDVDDELAALVRSKVKRAMEDSRYNYLDLYRSRLAEDLAKQVHKNTKEPVSDISEHLKKNQQFKTGHNRMFHVGDKRERREVLTDEYYHKLYVQKIADDIKADLAKTKTKNMPQSQLAEIVKRELEENFKSQYIAKVTSIVKGQLEQDLKQVAKRDARWNADNSARIRKEVDLLYNLETYQQRTKRQAASAQAHGDAALPADFKALYIQRISDDVKREVADRHMTNVSVRELNELVKRELEDNLKSDYIAQLTAFLKTQLESTLSNIAPDTARHRRQLAEIENVRGIRDFLKREIVNELGRDTRLSNATRDVIGDYIEKMFETCAARGGEKKPAPAAAVAAAAAPAGANPYLPSARHHAPAKDASAKDKKLHFNVIDLERGHRTDAAKDKGVVIDGVSEKQFFEIEPIDKEASTPAPNEDEEEQEEEEEEVEEAKENPPYLLNCSKRDRAQDARAADGCDGAPRRPGCPPKKSKTCKVKVVEGGAPPARKPGGAACSSTPKCSTTCSAPTSRCSTTAKKCSTTPRCSTTKKCSTTPRCSTTAKKCSTTPRCSTTAKKCSTTSRCSASTKKCPARKGTTPAPARGEPKCADKDGGGGNATDEGVSGQFVRIELLNMKIPAKLLNETLRDDTRKCDPRSADDAVVDAVDAPVKHERRSHGVSLRAKGSKRGEKAPLKGDKAGRRDDKAPKRSHRRRDLGKSRPRRWWQDGDDDGDDEQRVDASRGIVAKRSRGDDGEEVDYEEGNGTEEDQDAKMDDDVDRAETRKLAKRKRKASVSRKAKRQMNTRHGKRKKNKRHDKMYEYEGEDGSWSGTPGRRRLLSWNSEQEDFHKVEDSLNADGVRRVGGEGTLRRRRLSSTDARTGDDEGGGRTHFSVDEFLGEQSDAFKAKALAPHSSIRKRDLSTDPLNGYPRPPGDGGDVASAGARTRRRADGHARNLAAGKLSEVGRKHKRSEDSSENGVDRSENEDARSASRAGPEARSTHFVRRNAADVHRNKGEISAFETEKGRGNAFASDNLVDVSGNECGRDNSEFSAEKINQDGSNLKSGDRSKRDPAGFQKTGDRSEEVAESGETSRTKRNSDGCLCVLVKANLKENDQAANETTLAITGKVDYKMAVKKAVSDCGSNEATNLTMNGEANLNQEYHFPKQTPGEVMQEISAGLADKLSSLGSRDGAAKLMAMPAIKEDVKSGQRVGRVAKSEAKPAMSAAGKSPAPKTASLADKSAPVAQSGGKEDLNARRRVVRVADNENEPEVAHEAKGPASQAKRSSEESVQDATIVGVKENASSGLESVSAGEIKPEVSVETKCDASKSKRLSEGRPQAAPKDVQENVSSDPRVGKVAAGEVKRGVALEEKGSESKSKPLSGESATAALVEVAEGTDNGQRVGREATDGVKPAVAVAEKSSEQKPSACLAGDVARAAPHAGSNGVVGVDAGKGGAVSDTVDQPKEPTQRAVTGKIARRSNSEYYQLGLGTLLLERNRQKAANRDGCDAGNAVKKSAKTANVKLSTEVRSALGLKDPKQSLQPKEPSVEGGAPKDKLGDFEMAFLTDQDVHDIKGDVSLVDQSPKANDIAGKGGGLAKRSVVDVGTPDSEKSPREPVVADKEHLRDLLDSFGSGHQHDDEVGKRDLMSDLYESFGPETEAGVADEAHVKKALPPNDAPGNTAASEDDAAKVEKRSVKRCDRGDGGKGTSSRQRRPWNSNSQSDDDLYDDYDDGFHVSRVHELISAKKDRGLRGWRRLGLDLKKDARAARSAQLPARSEDYQRVLREFLQSHEEETVAGTDRDGHYVDPARLMRTVPTYRGGERYRRGTRPWQKYLDLNDEMIDAEGQACGGDGGGVGGDEAVEDGDGGQPPTGRCRPTKTGAGTTTEDPGDCDEASDGAGDGAASRSPSLSSPTPGCLAVAVAVLVLAHALYA